MNINGKTRIYGIIGNPVTHSLSPAMHNAAFAVLDENRVYLPFRVERVSQALTGLKGLNIGGASVTIPHKEAVIAELDEIDPIAEKIGAVNTIVVTTRGEEKKLFGTNTDWIGSNRALEQKIELNGSRAVILGAGGAARASRARRPRKMEAGERDRRSPSMGTISGRFAKCLFTTE